MFKKICAFFLSVMLALSFTACADKSGGGNNNAPAVPGEIDVWTTYGTEKVLRSYKPKDAAPINCGGTLKVEACQGEYEAGQVIMTATKAVSSFDVKISDLTSGSNTLYASNVELFAEKYVPVSTLSGGGSAYGFPTGWYPDALIPMSGYVAAGENKITEGENQGVYVSFNVPEDQVPGDYNGNITITYDGKTKTVPVTLTVYDLKVNKETHSKSYFNVWKTYYIGDLDTSQEMWDKFCKLLIDYRVSPSYVSRDGEKYNNGDTSDETVKAYAEAAAAWVDKGMSTINSPWKAYSTSNRTALTNLIVELANIQFDKYKDACIKAQKTNPEASLDEVSSDEYLDKVIVKGQDEPLYNNIKYSDVAKNTASFYTALENAVAKLEEKKEALAEDANKTAYVAYIDKMINQVNLIPDLITESARGLTDVRSKGNKVEENSIIDTACPVFDVYANQDLRTALETWVTDEQKEAQDKALEEVTTKEKWWYGCNTPKAPYPTYHIDDPLVLARSIDWFMNEYNIVGNLYWAVSSWNPQTGKEVRATDNYYEYNAIRNSSVNGEGYLVYPGAAYGVSGPVPSMRLQTIRDGNEDYELLYNLNIKYDELDGVDFRKVQPGLSSVVYSSDSVRIEDGANSSANFDILRRATIQLGLLANSDAKFCLTQLEKSKRGEKVTATFTWADGANVKLNGEDIEGSSYEDGEGRKKYSLTFSLDQVKNDFDIEVTTESGEEYKFDFGFGGKVILHEGVKLVNDKLISIEALEMDGDKPLVAVNTQTVSDGVKISIAEIPGSETEIIPEQGLKLYSQLFGADVKKVILYIKPTAKIEHFEVLVQYNGSNAELTSAFFDTLESGRESAIEIAIDATATRSVELLYIYTAPDPSQKDPPEPPYEGVSQCEFTITDMVLYYK